MMYCLTGSNREEDDLGVSTFKASCGEKVVVIIKKGQEQEGNIDQGRKVNRIFSAVHEESKKVHITFALNMKF